MAQKPGPKKAWKWDEEALDELAVLFEEWLQENGNIFLADFAYWAGIYEDDFCRWEKKSARFSRALKKCKAKQKNWLEKGTLFEGFEDPRTGKKRKVNSTGAMFLLKCNHGYRDNHNAQQNPKELAKEIIKEFVKVKDYGSSNKKPARPSEETCNHADAS